MQTGNPLDRLFYPTLTLIIDPYSLQCSVTHVVQKSSSFSNLGKRHLAKIGEKMIDLTSKLGEINNIEHNKGSKIYPGNQGFFRLYYAKNTT